MKKNLLKAACTFVNQISLKYNELDADTPIFDQFHDDMRVQRDCSYEVLDEIEEYLKLKDEKAAIYYIKQLEDTLVYCTYVIEMQEMYKNLPKSIFG